MIYKDRVSDYPAWGCFAVIILAVLIPVLVTVGLRALRYVVMSVAGLFGYESHELAKFFLGSLIAIFILPFLFMTMPALGLLWAPFATMICARTARARGLDSRRYAIAGAVYSVLFLLPSIFLIARIHNKSTPGCLTRSAYVLIYGWLWPVSTLSYYIFTLALPEPFWIVSVSLLLLNVLTWFISLIKLIVWHRRQARVLSEESDDVLPNRVYIMPFAYVLGWVLIAVPLFWWMISFNASPSI